MSAMLTAVSLGTDAEGTRVEPPSYRQARAARQRIRTLRGKASLVDAIARGEPYEQAVTEYVRAYVTPQTVGEMQMLCQALLATPDTAVAGELGWALLSRAWAVPQRAWRHFGRVPPEQWRRWAPDEYFRTAKEIGTAEVVAAGSRLVEEPADDVPDACWLALARAAFAVGEYDLARTALDRMESAGDRDPAADDGTRAEATWLGGWIDRAHRRPQRSTVAQPDGVAIGVLDYKQPQLSQTSRNLGDYLQTIAALGHLVRHRDLDVSGPPDLVEFIASLRCRVDDRMAIAGPSRRLTLVPINRDASSFDEISEPTWLLAFGWYMHDTFGTYDFPFPAGVKPLFVSFHCGRPELLTADAVAYLRRFGPIGCRDWPTVYLLHSLGVPSFFSGCITTTIDTVAARDQPTASDGPLPTAFVDRAVAWGSQGVHVTHAVDSVRTASLAANLTDALGLLDDYRQRYSRIVTSRLHCYLPARSVGTAVEFTPRNRADLRYNGLVGIDDAAFDAIRLRLNEQLASTLSLVLTGAGEEEVYTHWREIWAPDVEAAQHRITTVPPLPPLSFDVTHECKRIRSEKVDIAATEQPDGSTEIVDLAVAVDGNLRREFGVLLEALSTFSSRPLHVRILCRDHGTADFDRLARAFPGITFSWLPCDHVDYGEVGGMLRHVTISSLDRLLLPDVLDDVDRVVYLDIDVLPLGDVSELADWDLDGTPLAARTTFSTAPCSGYRLNVLDAALRQWTEPRVADDLLRRMASTFDAKSTSCNTGVMVLDLARMRQDDFCRRFIPLVAAYGMHDQQVLNIYSSFGRAPLPAEWNHIPSREFIDDPKLIHWAGGMKPWAQASAPLGGRWRQFASAFDARMAKVPAASNLELGEGPHEAASH